MNLRIDHSLEPADAAERLRVAALRLGLEFEPEPCGRRGKVAQSTPLGAVRAEYRLVEGAVEIEVTQKPAFLPDSAVKRAIEDGLRTELDATS